MSRLNIKYYAVPDYNQNLINSYSEYKTNKMKFYFNILIGF